MKAGGPFIVQTGRANDCISLNLRCSIDRCLEPFFLEVKWMISCGKVVTITGFTSPSIRSYIPCMQKSTSTSHTRSQGLLAINLILTGCIAILAWLAFRGPEGSVIHLAGWRTPQAEEVDGVVPAPSPPLTAPFTTPDPRFARKQATVLPEALSPEARQMAFTIQNKYRCAHCCDDESSLRCLPGLGGESSPDAKVLVAALGTLPDDCYVSTALPKVVDPNTPAELMHVLYDDLLRRPNPIKLRMLFIIAEIDGHPLASTALADLRTTLNLDHQQDWPRWEQAVNQQCAHEERGMRSDTCRIH